MDKSEIYIKMCDCPEIQKKKIEPRFPPILRSRLDKNISIFVNTCAESGIQSDLKGSFWFKARKWIPRQDEIQEMVQKFMAEEKSWKGVWALEQFFHNWFLDNAKIDIGTTMEQLWLAFYMHKEHGKIWDGEKWIKA